MICAGQVTETRLRVSVTSPPQRLAEAFEHRAAEFGKLVEEEDAVVGERHLAGPRRAAPAADHPGVRDRVVRRAERACLDEASAAQQPGDGVHLGGLEGFVEVHRREDARHASGEHRLARAGRPDEEHGAPRRGLEARRAWAWPRTSRMSGAEPRAGRARRRGVGVHAALARNRLAEVSAGVHAEALHDGGLGGVLGRDDEGGGAAVPRADGEGEHAADGPEGGVERELSEERDLFEALARGLRELLAGGEDAERDGQVEVRAVLAEVGGREVERDASHRPRDADVLDRRLYADARLPDRAVRQPGDVEGLQAEAEVDLSTGTAPTPRTVAERARANIGTPGERVRTVEVGRVARPLRAGVCFVGRLSALAAPVLPRLDGGRAGTEMVL